MIYYDKLYKLIGFRKLAHFLNPIVINTNEFEFPRNSILHYFKISDIKIGITRKDGLFNKIQNKVFIKTVFDYKPDNVLGMFRKITMSQNVELSELIKNEKTFKFLKPLVTNVNMVEKDLFIFHYGLLNSFYRYNSNPLNEYFKFHNAFNTLIGTINNTEDNDRNYFITVDLPNELPPIYKLNDYAIKINNQAMNVLLNYKYLNILEIWKFLTPDLKKDSLLNNIPSGLYKRINFIFTLDNKMAIINLDILLGIVKEYEIESKLVKHKAQTVRKLFYIFINSVIEKSALPISKIENIENLKDITISLDGISGTSKLVTKNNDDSEIDLDKYIEHNIKQRDVDDGINISDLDTAEVDEDTELKTSGTEIKETLDNIQINNEVSLTNISKTDLDFVTKPALEIDLLLESKYITKNEHIRLKTILEKQHTKQSPFEDKKISVGELLDDKNDDYELEKNELEITDNKIVFDKKYNKNIVNSVNKKYISTQLNKDILRSIYSIQNAGIIVEDHTIETNESILGSINTHNITLTALNGRKSTIKIDLPKIEEDGSFKISKNTYKMRNMRLDLPFRKIDNTTIALSSYYGKLFITKSTFKKDDIGYYLRKKIIEKNETDNKLRDIVLIPVENKDANLPLVYSLFSRYITAFKYDGIQYNFNYENRTKLLNNINNISLTKLEEHGVLIGIDNNIPIIMDENNKLYRYENNKFKEMDLLLNILNIDLLDGPVEYANIRLYKEQFPVGLLLMYYLGLENLLRICNSSFINYEAGKRVNLNKDEFKLTLKDYTVVVKRDNNISDMIIYGLSTLNRYLNKVTLDIVNSKSKCNILFNYLELSLLYTNEIKILEEMYVDPATKTVLNEMKLPNTFKGLLFKSAETLLDDNYKNPNNITEMSIKGYERLAGLVYNELITAVKEQNNKSFFSRSKVVVKPYGIMNKINEDSTTVLVDDLNPIAFIKQNEDVTYLGNFGRNKESMNRETRSIHSSEIGIISEASKDSGDVGISAYLTANPNLTNLRGTIKEYDVNNDSSWSEMLSSSAILSPFSINEDVKRNNFISIQNSHVIPMVNMRVPYIRTGYEAIIPIKSDGKFIKIAKEDGVVTKVSKTEIVVEYISGNKEKIKLHKWTTKEESGSCYTHELVSNVKENDKFIKDDTLSYVTSFFEPDIFNPKRVIYKAGTYVNVCLMEDLQTYEDSAAISKKMNNELGTVITKVKSYIINNDDNIINMVKVNSEIKATDILYTNISGDLGDTSKLDARTIEILQNLKSSSPKAKVNGIVDKIEFYYNCELTDLSKSIKTLVSESDDILNKNYGYSGRVNSSYSIDGVPLLENQLQIKIYIKVNDSMGIGDKAILGNQLKFTVGEVYDYNISMLDGTEIDVLFSNKSIAARIVNSPILIGTTSTVLDILTKKATELYFS